MRAALQTPDEAVYKRCEQFHTMHPFSVENVPGLPRADGQQLLWHRQAESKAAVMAYVKKEPGSSSGPPQSTAVKATTTDFAAYTFAPTAPSIPDALNFRSSFRHVAVLGRRPVGRGRVVRRQGNIDVPHVPDRNAVHHGRRMGLLGSRGVRAPESRGVIGSPLWALDPTLSLTGPKWLTGGSSLHTPHTGGSSLRDATLPTAGRGLITGCGMRCASGRFVHSFASYWQGFRTISDRVC